MLQLQLPLLAPTTPPTHRLHLLLLLRPVHNLRHILGVLVQLQAQQVLHPELLTHLKVHLRGWGLGPVRGGVRD